MNRLTIPDEELRWRFSRSSGPGGQHVNTTDSRVEVSWSLTDTAILDTETKHRVATRLRSRVNADGTITVASSRYRSQHRNRQAARLRLEELVAQAAVPVPRRVPTRATRAAQQRRLDAKRRRSELKRSRRMEL